MTLPPSPISRAAAWVQENALVSVLSSIFRQRAAVSSPRASTGWIPALLTSAWRPPPQSATVSSRAWQAWSSVSSAANARARPPAASIAATTSSAAPGRRWCTATAAPASANRSAIPRPITPEAPVTQAIVPVRSGREVTAPSVAVRPGPS